MLKRILIIALLTSVFFSGCRKDELTLPAKVDFVFEMNPFDTESDDELKNVTTDTTTLSNDPFDDDKPGFGEPDFESLSINQAELIITAIEIEGVREQGKDVFMVSEFNPPLEAQLTGNNVSDYNISFDLPQGVYEKLDIQFYLGTDDAAAISFNGDINPGKSKKVNFKFEHTLKERIRVRAFRNNPADPIVLNKNANSRAHIIIDARYLFQNITMDQLESSTIINTPAGQQIRINHNDNKQIFGPMAGRLDKSIAVVFE